MAMPIMYSIWNYNTIHVWAYCQVTAMCASKTITTDCPWLELSTVHITCMVKYCQQLVRKQHKQLPGQSCVLQSCHSSPNPTQSSPPCWGSTQFLALLCCPPPHDTLHEPQLSQISHSPSTEKFAHSAFPFITFLLSMRISFYPHASWLTHAPLRYPLGISSDSQILT